MAVLISPVVLAVRRIVPDRSVGVPSGVVKERRLADGRVLGRRCVALKCVAAEKRIEVGVAGAALVACSLCTHQWRARLQRPAKSKEAKEAPKRTTQQAGRRELNQ